MNNIVNFLRRIFRTINCFIEGKLTEFESKERVSNFIENKVKISSQSMDDINMVLTYFVDIMLIIFTIYVIHKIIDMIARKRRKRKCYSQRREAKRKCNAQKRGAKRNKELYQFGLHQKMSMFMKEKHNAKKRKSRKKKKNRKGSFSIISFVKNLLNKVHFKKNKRKNPKQSSFCGYEDDYSYDESSTNVDNTDVKRKSYEQRSKMWKNTDKDATCICSEDEDFETTNLGIHNEHVHDCNRYMTKCNEKLKENTLPYVGGSTITFSTEDCNIQQKENTSVQKDMQTKSSALNEDGYSHSAHKVMVRKRKKKK